SPRASLSASTPFPYTTLFRSRVLYQLSYRGSSEILMYLQNIIQNHSHTSPSFGQSLDRLVTVSSMRCRTSTSALSTSSSSRGLRSEEHTSELQSRFDLVCRLL